MTTDKNAKPETATFLDRVTEIADELNLEGEKRERYIDNHMMEAGYRRVPTYVKDDPDPSGDESGSGGGKVASIFGNDWFGKTGS